MPSGDTSPSIQCHQTYGLAGFDGFLNNSKSPFPSAGHIHSIMVRIDMTEDANISQI